MNTQRFLALIQALEDADPDHFQMDRYSHNCGSPACVLGHYAARRDLQQVFYLTRAGVRSIDHQLYVGYETAEILDHFGIGYNQAHELFSETGCGRAETPEEAIEYIKGFMHEQGYRGNDGNNQG